MIGNDCVYPSSLKSDEIAVSSLSLSEILHIPGRNLFELYCIADSIDMIRFINDR